MSLNGEETEDKELALALQILKFQCDHTLNGDFNKKLKEIDSQLLEMRSNHRTIDILNNLLLKLPSVIGTIKFLEMLNEQEKVKTPIVEKNNNNLKPEIIDEDEIVVLENQIEASSSSLPNEIPESSQNHDPPTNSISPCRKSKRKSANKANQVLTSTSPPKNPQQQQTPISVQNTFRDAKFEHHLYSSSEESSLSENENERENQRNENQQQSSLLTQQDSTSKLEKVVEEESVEEVPETPEMTVDEIQKLAAENAKRNKRIRYFSTDSEDENINNNKNKKKKDKKCRKSSVEKPQEIQNVENGKDKSSVEKPQEIQNVENGKDKSSTEKPQENQKTKKRGRPPKSRKTVWETFFEENSPKESSTNDDQLNNLNTEQNFLKIGQQLIQNWLQNQPTTAKEIINKVVEKKKANNKVDVAQMWWYDPLLYYTVSKIGSVHLTVTDIDTLEHGNWLNDQIIDAYMELIKIRSQKNPALPKVYVFSTFFYIVLMERGYKGVSRYAAKVDIFLYDILLFPICNDDHWTLIAVDLKRDLFGYFDSVDFEDYEAAVQVGRVHIRRIYDYLKTESFERRAKEYQRKSRKASIFNSPIQDNENDGGVFICCYAKELALGNEFGRFRFTQDDIPKKRKQITYELLTGALIE